ncbi:MAG: DUF3303 family protein [Solirubrobacterales bacterium]
MKFAIIYRPKSPPPPGSMPEMLKGMGDWMQAHGNRVEGIQFFVGGGGFGTIETDDPAELTGLLAANPFTQYSEVEVKPILDPAAAIAALQEAYS